MMIQAVSNRPIWGVPSPVAFGKTLEPEALKRLAQTLSLKVSLLHPGASVVYRNDFLPKRYPDGLFLIQPSADQQTLPTLQGDDAVLALLTEKGAQWQAGQLTLKGVPVRFDIRYAPL